MGFFLLKKITRLFGTLRIRLRLFIKTRITEGFVHGIVLALIRQYNRRDRMYIEIDVKKRFNIY